MKAKGAIAAGHPETARAAAIILEEGGNAFDAALAGLCAAGMAEPVLTSLGGGGFLLARTEMSETTLYDFFVQTPKSRKDDLDFFPIMVDFGTAQQEFHIGRGSIATPGTVKGMFRVHEDLGSMPMTRIVEPAVALAKEGVAINRLQGYIFEVVEKIYNSNEACRAIFASPKNPSKLIGEGETIRNHDYADALQSLALEGEDLFYKGEIARQAAEDCLAGGGTLTMEDLDDYRVVLRKPLEIEYATARLYANPPPSTGGILIAFALEMLKGTGLGALNFGTREHLERLALVMELTNKARVESCLHEADETEAAGGLLDPGFLEIYRRQVLGRPSALRGTTHINVIDAKGNAASLSLSNGEGSAYIVPGTGIMLNNMLGEEDINPHGFHQWPADVRMCSMMSPTLMAETGGAILAVGSGGSNRIRTAILQVLLNLLEFKMPVADAVASPRIHFEGGLLSIEDGFNEDEVSAIQRKFPEAEVWGEINLFFGGVHSVRFDPGQGRFEGAGDSRRGGVSLTV
ncbi:MAG: gamma-glutamyltransferase [Rhodospirillales bacterium]